jgi:hypothetical protein
VIGIDFIALFFCHGLGKKRTARAIGLLEYISRHAVASYIKESNILSGISNLLSNTINSISTVVD